MIDVELVDRTIAGDQDAFKRLHDKYKRMVRTVVGRIAGYGEADDISQDVFLKAYLRLSTFKPELGSFETWLYRIAATSAISFVRSHNYNTPVDDDVIQAQIEENWEREFDSFIARIDLEKMLSKLRPQELEALLGFHLEGNSWQELEDKTNVKTCTLRKRAQAAAKRMREE